MLLNAIARWQAPICPDFKGLAPQYVTVMETRFRTIAGEAGARSGDKGCKPNLVVVVTRQPQAYLDEIHAGNVDVLGYHGVTTITHPVQAWYVTGMKDIRGKVFIDKDSSLALDCPSGDCYGGPVRISNANTAPVDDVGGWRAATKSRAICLYATVIVDAAATARYQVGEMADYVAMLALSRTEDYGDCQLMPSITNLMTPNCDDKLKPDRITPTDIAYLRGIYKMDPGAKLLIQQDEIAAEMAASLGAGK